MLNSNTWNHLTVCKQRIWYQIELLALTILEIILTVCKHRIISIRKQYLKPFRIISVRNTWNHLIMRKQIIDI